MFLYQISGGVINYVHECIPISARVGLYMFKSSFIQIGACPQSALKVINKILKVILFLTLSQRNTKYYTRNYMFIFFTSTKSCCSIVNVLQSVQWRTLLPKQQEARRARYCKYCMLLFSKTLLRPILNSNFRKNSMGCLLNLFF